MSRPGGADAIIVEQSRACSPHEAASLERGGHNLNVERCNYVNNLALCLKRQKKYADALVLYRQCVAMPEAPEHVRHNLAQCEMVLNKPTVGHAAYAPPEPAAAIQLTGESDGAARDRIRELGNDAFRRCRYDEALRMYSAAMAVDDAAAVAEKATPAERAKLLSNRAAAALGHDDYDAAATDAAAATSYDPQNAKAWYRLGLAEWCRRLRGGEPCVAALDALTRALALDPENGVVQAKLAEVEATQREEAARGEVELPSNAIDLGACRFADTPLGRLDRLVGTEGLEAVTADNGWLRGVYEAAALWHQGLRDCQAFRRAGVDLRREVVANAPRGAAQAASGTGAGRECFAGRVVDVLRPMSDALFHCDEVDICCPLLAWLGGKLHNNAPPLSAEQVCRAAMALDLTRPEECEKVELTLRYACLMQSLTMVKDVLPSAVPQLAPCASSGRAWRLRAAWYSQSKARPRGSPPPPRGLKRASSKVADSTAI